MREDVFCLTIDLDTPTEYAAVHGVRLSAEDPHLVYRSPLQRFAELCDALDARATVFAIGRDVCGVATQALLDLIEREFEIGCHSHQHDYQLSRRHPGFILSDLRTARATLQNELGVDPVGFRAPGHHLSAPLLDALETADFVYSSSVLPSPLYYGAKAGVMATYWLSARPTTALLGSPQIGFAPRHPYHPGREPYRTGERQLWELPISVAGRARLPAIGAAFLLAPSWVRSHLLTGLAKEPTLIINLHAMDFVDPEVDGLPEAVARRQPELRIPVAERTERLLACLEQLRRGRRELTLGELVGTLP